MSHSVEVESLATNHYFDRQFGIGAVKVLPGEYFVSRKEILMVTTLGSCIAACIRDRVHGIGGINHFMLPETGSDSVAPASAPARYGSYAMELLINELIKNGARRSNLEAKIFGGGNVIENMTVTKVGARNATFALKYLETEGIPVVAKDVLGSFPRKVYFFSDTGRTLIKKLRGMRNDTLIVRETDYAKRISRVKEVSGEVELF
ncbi:MAG: chemoreceptor glutamine deamidase CheD [Betaproteobacteria bacterium]|nr:chemoreceptor glutamine deamidase CheD [Betaproteobacteria bacterium]